MQDVLFKNSWPTTSAAFQQNVSAIAGSLKLVFPEVS